MGLQVYRILAEVAEQQSFSKAAERLHLTRSAVSHAVVKLEREYGFALFLRTGASVQPTEEGRRLLPEIFGLLRMEENLRGQVAGIRAGVGERVCLGVFGTLALGAFLIFHLFLYVYNFRETDAANLQDYIRYIGPYYMGFFLMALGLLARYAAAESRAAKLAGAVPAGVLLGFCALIVWRGMPTAGFWNYPHSVYSVRQDVKERAETVNGLLDWDDTVLLISQGDTAIRWNYYGFELNATLARGFGGFGYGHEGDYNWDTTHMNLVSPEAAGEGVPEVYSYQTVADADDLRLFLLDKKYTHVLVDASDDYIADVIGPAFGCEGLPDDKPDEPVLLAIEYDGDTVRWTRVEGGAA